MNKLRIIYFGTPDFAVPPLDALVLEKNFELIGVITQPDKKTGRKQVVSPPPVKLAALSHGIEVFQPEKISFFADSEKGKSLFERDIDAIIVAAYSQILPKKVLAAPKLGCLNIHASLLPKYRGASPIQAAIMNGDTYTGVTIMLMDAGLDTGPVLSQNMISIEPDDTANSLSNRLSEAGAELIVITLKKLAKGEVDPEPQNESLATYVRMLKKADGKIDWKSSSDEIERFIRAMYPWPIAYTEIEYNQRTVRIEILKASVLESATNINVLAKSPGSLVKINDLLIAFCGKGFLNIERLKPEGKREMSAREFINGYGKLLLN